MSDIQAKFEKAVMDSKKLKKKPSNDMLLKLYAYYKQSLDGDVTGQRPGFTDFVGAAKWDAWNKIKGTGAEDAMQQYTKLVERLKREEAP